MDIAPAALAPVRELYTQGLYLQAYRAAQALGPLRDWANTPARLLAGRLALQLGGPRLFRHLHLTAYRAAPTDAEANCCYARLLLERRGPYAAWRFARKQDDWSDVAPDLRAEWFALHAHFLARLRDHDRAERWMRRAEALTPDDDWLAVERASVFEYADRLDEALASGRRALALHPWFRPGVQVTAHLLIKLGRSDEAVALLSEAVGRLECGALAAQLAGLLLDLDRAAEARAYLDRFAELSPLMEEEVADWLAARRCDVAYFTGDRDTARTLARAIKEPFYARLAERLDRGVPPRRQLPADFLALPSGATVLTVLARYWQAPLEPLEGLLRTTPPNSATAFAPPEAVAAAGWRAHEFSVTGPAAAALIDRGLPFVLVADDAPVGAASPLVVGIDPGRGTLLVRSVGDHRTGELALETLADPQRASSPRGLLLVPASAAGRAVGVELPEEALHARLDRMQRALEAHRRDEADRLLKELEAAAPDHALTVKARCALARADGDPSAVLTALAPLLERFPQDGRLQFLQSNALRDLGHNRERQEILGAIVGRADADPLVQLQYAQLLLNDPRQAGRARRILERLLRQQPNLPGPYHVLANLRWEQRRFGEALELYRIAAGLDDADEQSAQAFMRAARGVDQADDALRYLRDRFNRLGERLPGPGKTLATALDELDRTDEALEVLQEALAKRPADGDLLLFAAEFHAAAGRPDREAELLEAARAHAPRPAWLRAAAGLALRRLDLAGSLAHWREYLALDPLALDANRSAARLLGDTVGPAAARAHLRDASERFPHHYGLNQLRVEWLRSADLAEAEPVIRRMTARHPHDAWAWRELALRLADAKRHDEARAALETAARLEPDAPSLPGVAGRVHTLAGRKEQASQAYEDAVRRSSDNDLAINELVQLAPDREEKRAALELVEEEMARQGEFNDGVFAYRDQASQTDADGESVLEPEEVLATLQRLLDEHPDRWAAWSALVQQYAVMERFDEAQALAEEATERFPLLPRLWLDRATVCRIREDAEGQAEALGRALVAHPGWGMAARELSEVLEQTGEGEEARHVLERAVAAGPLEAVNHGYLAETLWNLGESEAALARIQHAIRVDPGYDWAWRSFSDWADRMDRGEEVLGLARSLTKLRAGDVRAWLALVRCLNGPAFAAEALAALDKAYELDPHNVEVCDLRAERLAEAGRYDEALATLRQAVPGADAPLVLQGRQAWVEAKRGNYAAAIPKMQALVAGEPGYYWGWQNLADWNSETGRQAAYLEAAAELVRLRPDHPSALARRGEARLQTGDREGGKEDLRQAQQLAPDYAFAGMALFDAHLADDELDEAGRCLAILQEHISDDFVLARQVQLAARREDKEAALDALREIAESGGEAPWPLQTAVAAVRGAGWSDEADAVLDEVIRGRIVHAWAVLTWVEGPRGQAASLDDRLAALDRLAERKPHFLQAYDLKAELLAREGRYDEAKAACRPKALGDDPPTMLKGRAAWLEAARGDRRSAITRMRAVVGADPDYFWGWQQLAHWYDAQDDHANYVEAAEQLVRLAPRDPESFGCRGDARLGAGDREGAKKDFQHAFGLDPHYAFAGLRLIDQQLQDGELDAAAETLSALRANADSPFVRMQAVRLAVKRGDRPSAVEGLRELCAESDAPPALLQRAVESLVEADWAESAEQVLAAALEESGTHPAAARLWVDRQVARGDWSFVDRLDALLERGEVGEQALEAYVSALNKPARLPRLLECLSRYGEVLRRTTRGWGKAGGALAGAEDFAGSAKWMADWAERADVESWMLINLSIALRSVGRTDEAHRVHEHALGLAESDYTTVFHRVWLALDAALAGRTDEAEDRLADVDDGALDAYHRLVKAMAQALVLVQRAALGRARSFADARTNLAEAVRENAGLEPDPGIVRAYRATVKRLARDAGGLSAWVWALRESWKPPIPERKGDAETAA
jgi:tetratricopeptide (TPR) repeat protein